MPPTPPNQKAGDLHEVFLAELFGGTKTRASGSKWFEQGDVRNNHDEPFAFCVDGKSTRGQQIAITLAIIAKLREQSQGERPALGLRWYANENLDRIAEDWVAFQAEDARELLEAARKLALLEAEFGDLARFLGDRHVVLKVDEAWTDAQVEEFAEGLQDAIAQDLPAVHPGTVAGEIARWRSAAEASDEQLQAATGEIARLREELDSYRAGRVIPPHVPAAPWTVIYKTALPGRNEVTGIHYDAGWIMTQVKVNEVRIERSMSNRPRIIVNNTLVSNCDVYIDGKMEHRAWAGNPDGEAG